MKKELTIFGIIVFLIGLFCVFYRTQRSMYEVYKYPYQTVGLILIVAGILVTVLGFLKKEEAKEEKT